MMEYEGMRERTQETKDYGVCIVSKRKCEMREYGGGRE